jgi:hypothetical protein
MADHDMISQNGWPVYDTTEHFVRGSANGFSFWAADDDVALIFDELIRRYVQYVEHLDLKSCWSWAERAIRGESTGYSNHASATALDLNAQEYPRNLRNMLLSKVAAVRKYIVDFFRGIIRWGGDYLHAPVDQMHFEINANAAKVKAFADNLRVKREVADVAGIEWTTQVPLTAKDAVIMGKKSDGTPYKAGDTVSFGDMIRYPIELRRVEAKVDTLSKQLTNLINALLATTLKKT